MSGCDEIRELLGLAAAGELDAEAEDRVARHVQDCAACAAELEDWQFLARGLRRLPTPRPPAAVVERARAKAAFVFAQQEERRHNRGVLILVIGLAWLMVFASWPAVRLLTEWLQLWSAAGAPETWRVFEGITLAGWLAGGAAAAILAWHQNRERRLA